MLLTAFASGSCATEYQLLDAPKEQPPPPDCITACAEAISAGCEYVACDFGIGADYEGEADLFVFQLEGSIEGADTCQMVARCPEADACTLAYQACLADSGARELCAADYELCIRAEACAGPLYDCTNVAELVKEQCFLDTPDEECQATYDTMMEACTCFYDDCLTEESLDCVPDQAAARVAPPVQIGATTWMVPEPFLTEQSSRLESLTAATRLWPVANAAGTQWRGLRLFDLDPTGSLLRLGFRPGDVIRAIGGRPIIPVLASPTALRELIRADQLEIEVERGGVPRRHHFRRAPAP